MNHRSRPMPARAITPPARRAGPWWALLVAGVFALAPIAIPHAASAEPGDEDLFAELLEGTSPGEWRGVLKRICEEKDATWIGTVLGGLFRDPALHARHADKAAYTAAYLADRPQNGKVILGTAVVRRAHGDEAFLSAMLSNITKGEGGWGRLLGSARELLAGDDLQARRAAIWFLSHENGEQGEDERETVRGDLLARLKEDLPLLQGPNGLRATLAEEYLAGFERFLAFRFPNVDEAVNVLDELKALDFAQLVKELSKRKSRPDAPDRKKLIEYGKRLIDMAVAGGKPETLEEFLGPARTPYVELRRYAIQKAGQLAPEPNATWGGMFRGILDHETDAEVLRQALTLLERAGFAEAAEFAPPLAASLAGRLRERGPGAAGARDALADRVRMAKLLGSLKVRSKDFDGLLGDGERLEGEVLAELVRALGGIAGVSVDEVLVHYRRNGKDPDRDRLVRIAAVDALGRSGFQTGNGQPEWAAAALREILDGEGEGNLGRSEDSETRRHAIRSLGIHPGAATAEVLRGISAGADEQEARVAMVVLRKAGMTDAHSVQALGAIAQDGEVPPARRIEALKALGTLASAAEGPRALASEAARTTLAAKGPDEVRLEAAATSAALADPLALEPMLQWWSEGSNDDRRSALRALILAVTKAGPENDALIASTLIGIGQAGDAEDLAFASDLALEVTQIAPRAPFEVARARILYASSGQEDEEKAARRQALAVAVKLLQKVAKEAGANLPADVLALLVRAHRRAGDLAAGDAEKKRAYLDAVHRATASEDAEIAQLGLETADLLEAEPLQGLMAAGEVQRLAEDRRALESKLGG